MIAAISNCRGCLTNHMGSISHHIMLLVFNILWGGHTCTQVCRIHGKSYFKKLATHPVVGQCVPGLKSEETNSSVLKLDNLNLYLWLIPASWQNIYDRACKNQPLECTKSPVFSIFVQS